MSLFEKLNKIDVNGHTEKKNNLTYLSWAWAWKILKENEPTATYKVYENKEELNYHHDNKTAWVKVGVMADGIEHIEYLPIMDYKNKSIPLDQITSFNVNTSIQRALTKAIARHGLGLYIYAGEDLPEPPTTEMATDEQCTQIEALLAETKANVQKFNEKFNITFAVQELTSNKAQQAIRLLLQKKAEQNASA